MVLPQPSPSCCEKTQCKIKRFEKKSAGYSCACTTTHDLRVKSFESSIDNKSHSSRRSLERQIDTKRQSEKYFPFRRNGKNVMKIKEEFEDEDVLKIKEENDEMLT